MYSHTYFWDASRPAKAGATAGSTRLNMATVSGTGDSKKRVPAQSKPDSFCRKINTAWL